MFVHELETIGDFQRALERFEEALDIPRTHPLAIDGTIQRFEFSFELAWKAIKVIALRFGADRRSPREAIKAAYGFSWIHEEALWLKMLDDRNLCSHTYKEEIAQAVYERLPMYAKIMRELGTSLSKALLELDDQ
jgi:nucleotidyltransferase substrate binding protein (TIGR01987 family)